ncbi:MAG: hypothetical protein RLZZ414_79, partial [Bacteroidota bacterium]
FEQHLAYKNDKKQLKLVWLDVKA